MYERKHLEEYRAIDLASDEKAVDSKARTGTSKLESQGVIRSVRNIENGDVSFIINTQQLELCKHFTSLKLPFLTPLYSCLS